jgi:hypothetical protein
MPKNGETNQKFGFYQNLCCGKEIVVPEGNEFPRCPNHPNLMTIWRPLIEHIAIKPAKTPAAAALSHYRAGDQIRIVGTAPQKGNRGRVVEVIEGPMDNMYRYQVRLDDGSTIRCFGFELELIGEESLRAA